MKESSVITHITGRVILVFWQHSVSCWWPYVQAMAVSKPFCVGDRLGPINANESYITNFLFRFEDVVAFPGFFSISYCRYFHPCPFFCILFLMSPSSFFLLIYPHQLPGCHSSASASININPLHHFFYPPSLPYFFHKVTVFLNCTGRWKGFLVQVTKWEQYMAGSINKRRKCTVQTIGWLTPANVLLWLNIVCTSRHVKVLVHAIIVGE